MMSNTYSLFDGRYSVEVGKRGGVIVNSRAKQYSPMKVYGKQKDGIRFVNLIEDKEQGYKSYSLESIKNHLIDGTELVPLSDDDISSAMSVDPLPCLLKSVRDIECLPMSVNKFGREVFTYDTKFYRVFYTKRYLGFYSNGWSKFRYDVNFSSIHDNYTRTSKTDNFISKGSIGIDDIKNVPLYELKEIVAFISDEIRDRESNQTLGSYEHYSQVMSSLLEKDYTKRAHDPFGDNWREVYSNPDNFIITKKAKQ